MKDVFDIDYPHIDYEFTKESWSKIGGFIKVYSNDLEGYKKAVKDLELYKDKQTKRIVQLENLWLKLKECIDKELQKDIKRSDLKHESFVICEQFVLDKMQELENGEKK